MTFSFKHGVWLEKSIWSIIIKEFGMQIYRISSLNSVKALATLIGGLPIVNEFDAYNNRGRTLDIFVADKRNIPCATSGAQAVWCRAPPNLRWIFKATTTTRAVPAMMTVVVIFSLLQAALQLLRRLHSNLQFTVKYDTLISSKFFIANMERMSDVVWIHAGQTLKLTSGTDMKKNPLIMTSPALFQPQKRLQAECLIKDKGEKERDETDNILKYFTFFTQCAGEHWGFASWHVKSQVLAAPLTPRD